MKNKNFILVYQNNTSSHLIAMMHLKIKTLGEGNFIIETPCYFYNMNSKILNQPYHFNPSAFEQSKLDKKSYEHKFKVNYVGLLVFVLSAILIAKTKGYELIPTHI